MWPISTKDYWPDDALDLAEALITAGSI